MFKDIKRGVNKMNRIKFLIWSLFGFYCFLTLGYYYNSMTSQSFNLITVFFIGVVFGIYLNEGFRE